MAVHIPKQHFIGINLTRDDNENSEMPLGFLTPDGTDKAAEKRKATVMNWLTGWGNYGHSQWVDRVDLDQFMIDYPHAVRHPTARAEKDSVYIEVPLQEGQDYKLIKESDNVPQAGFRITRSVARYGWNGGNKLVRVEDPRGFELEISVDNLVKIMSMSTFVDGLCMEECVWGRAGSQNILLPVNSEPYRAAVENTVAKNTKVMSLKDVNFGDMVTVKSSTTSTESGKYLGAYHLYSTNPARNNPYNGHAHDVFSTLRRYVLEVEDADGNKEYKLFASMKVTEVTAKGSGDRPATLDVSKLNIDEYRYSDFFAVTAKKHKVADIAQHIDFVEIKDPMIAEKLEASTEYHLQVWTKTDNSNEMLICSSIVDYNYGRDDNNFADQFNCTEVRFHKDGTWSPGREFGRVDSHRRSRSLNMFNTLTLCKDSDPLYWRRFRFYNMSVVIGDNTYIIDSNLGGE